jgi:hypothetical protein
VRHYVISSPCHVDQSISEFTERSGNVIENKGPALETWERTGNVIEKKGGYGLNCGNVVEKK